MDLRLSFAVHPNLYHTSQCMENLIFLALQDLIGSCVLHLNQIYRCHRLQILQQEAHVVHSHKL